MWVQMLVIPLTYKNAYLQSESSVFGVAQRLEDLSSTLKEFYHLKEIIRN